MNIDVKNLFGLIIKGVFLLSIVFWGGMVKADITTWNQEELKRVRKEIVALEKSLGKKGVDIEAIQNRINQLNIEREGLIKSLTPNYTNTDYYPNLFEYNGGKYIITSTQMDGVQIWKVSDGVRSYAGGLGVDGKSISIDREVIGKFDGTYDNGKITFNGKGGTTGTMNIKESTIKDPPTLAEVAKSTNPNSNNASASQTPSTSKTTTAKETPVKTSASKSKPEQGEPAEKSSTTKTDNADPETKKTTDKTAKSGAQKEQSAAEAEETPAKTGAPKSKIEQEKKTTETANEAAESKSEKKQSVSKAKEMKEAKPSDEVKETKAASQQTNSDLKANKIAVDDKGNVTLTRQNGTKETWQKTEDGNYRRLGKDGKPTEETMDGGKFREKVLGDNKGKISYADMYKDPDSYRVDPKTHKVYDAKSRKEIGEQDPKTGDIKFTDGSKGETAKKTQVKTVVTQNVAQYVLLILEALEGRKTKKVSKRVSVKAGQLQNSQGAQSAAAALQNALSTPTKSSDTPIEATTIAGASDAMIRLLQMSPIDLSLLDDTVNPPQEPEPEPTEPDAPVPSVTIVGVHHEDTGTGLSSSAVGGTQMSSSDKQAVATTTKSVAPMPTTTTQTTQEPQETAPLAETEDDTEYKKIEIRHRRALLLAEWAVAATNIGEGSNAISNQFYDRAGLFVAAANTAEGSLGGASAINDTDRFVLFELTRGAALSAVQLGLNGAQILNEIEGKE